jgi:hypothetical protein
MTDDNQSGGKPGEMRGKSNKLIGAFFLVTWIVMVSNILISDSTKREANPAKLKST